MAAVAHADRLGDFTTDKRVILLSTIALVIGLIGALVAVVLLWLIAVITNVSFFGRLSSSPVIPSQSHLGLWIIFIPAIGGLIIGLMARYGSEKIRGHGIPEALEAILLGQSKIGVKVALLKPLSSAISIGTGGPFGAEGPIIMTGGACGSLFAQYFHLSAAERKTLLVAGAAAGMSAVFATPVAAVLIAVELLLFEWKPRSLIPVAVASTAAASLRVPLLGAGPVFPIPAHALLDASGLIYACLLGLVVGIGSGLLTKMVYAFEDLFLRLTIHWMWWPVIGGLCIGVGGYIDPRVLGVGYQTIHQLLNGQVLGVAAISLVVTKSLVWSISLGSGTSGGVLAPLLMMGGAMGALLGQVIPVGTPGLWAMIGMAAMMGGTMRSPLTSIIFMLELTNDVKMLPALLIACVAAEVVTVLWLKRSILTEKLARRGYHLTREYAVNPFEIHRVGEIMATDYATVQADTLVHSLGDPAFPGYNWFITRHALPVLDSGENIVGMFTQIDYLKSVQAEGGLEMTVLEACNQIPNTVIESDVVRTAVEKLLGADTEHLIVVSDCEPRRVVGFVDRSDALDSHMHWFNEEQHRERPRKLFN